MSLIVIFLCLKNIYDKKKSVQRPNLSSTYNTHVHTFTLCCLLSRLKPRLNYHSFALHMQIQKNIMMFTLKGNASPDTTIWYQSARGIWEVSWSGIHTHWSPCGRQTQQIAFARKLWLASLLEQKKNWEWAWTQNLQKNK